MEPTNLDKELATKYLLNPLNEPEPREVTGPGAHFVGPNSMYQKPTSIDSAHIKTPPHSYPTPPTSASPTRSSFHASNPLSPSYRQSAFSNYNESTHKGKGRQRSSSLNKRFPGDMSDRPLDQLRKEAKLANRAPHLRKKHLPGADSIDTLDATFPGMSYHHEGPYDATLISRNTVKNSPLEAVKDSNAEALRATPRENLRDALDRHVPLQGTSIIPPGMFGIDGKTMRYKEGADLMREEDAPGGAYRRTPGVKYLPEDFKGKGEPSFTIERQLKDHKHGLRQTIIPDESLGYEMQTPNSGMSRQRSGSANHAEIPALDKSRNMVKHSEYDSSMRRSNTTDKKVGEGLKNRFASLKLSKKPSSD
ncbi:hypothetical protein BJ878DRAFT_528418 [Calycina marina]|uniref:Uncharacterized protein n=1 Tax=Calycina marina TaxID=1763456 RepID=A0A9P7YVC8_9HELO|nr:hypothetical protein BJ878DRAFT_528418 [Calycina marina]